MSDEVDDVTADPSSAPATEGGTTAPGPVSPALPDDRPVQNVMAEFNRKFSRLENQQAQLMQLMAQQVTQATPAKGDPTDDELWSLAQQGDRGAFQELNRRQARQEAMAVQMERSREQVIDQQLNSLASRYPVFNDNTHPLTQTVASAYQIMVNNGYRTGKATLLDAMKTAIADRPDLVADMVGRTPEQARVSATRRAQAGQTGTTVRDAPLGGPRRTSQVSPQQQKIASAMGIKDAAGAIERFKKRQESGQSSFGQVGQSLNEQEI